MHTWLPDAHSQAPAPISALLSGSLLNCAFLGLLRAHSICAASGNAQFSSHLLVAFGLLSVAWAAIFIARQSDYKRLLAYSSVENMGILALGAGLGKPGVTGALLHAINHSLTKGMLFLVAGNLLIAFRSKRVAAIRGAREVVPASAILWLCGFLAITGTPPFGTFSSKFLIVRAALEQNLWWSTAAFLGLLIVIFVGMANVFVPMFFGKAKQEGTHEEDPAAILPAAALCAAVLMLGFYVPQTLWSLIEQVGGLF